MKDGSIIMMVYLGFSLVSMATDALITYLWKARYNWINSLALALLWPVTCCAIIFGVIFRNSKRRFRR
jgi:hypothetical protein